MRFMTLWRSLFLGSIFFAGYYLGSFMEDHWWAWAIYVIYMVTMIFVMEVFIYVEIKNWHVARMTRAFNQYKKMTPVERDESFQKMRTVVEDSVARAHWREGS